jgi:glycerophosphoryl diester phosphodiesterase
MLPKIFLETPFAHRTLHNVSDGRPENSIAGVKAAIEHGYGIEIDLQISKDGIPMVFHDYSLERLTDETGAVAQFTAAELGAMTLKGGKEGIPTFETFLKFVDGRVPILVEIKDQDGALGPNVGPLSEASCALLKEYNGPKALMSFNPHAIAKCAKFAPEIVHGLVTGAFIPKKWEMVPKARLDELAEIPDYDRVGACFISHNIKYLNDVPVKVLKDRGSAILCWTVRSSEVEKQARLVADNITFEGYLA